MKKLNKEIKSLMREHLKPNLIIDEHDPSQDAWDHNQIRYNQISVDKTDLENLLEAVFEKGSEQGVDHLVNYIKETQKLNS